MLFFAELIAFGVGVGVLSGMLGIGGGIVLVPGLMLLFRFSQQEAQGTSLAAMIPPIGIFAAIVYYQHGFVRVPVAGAVALGFMIGALLGAMLVPHVPVPWIRLAFGGLLLYLGLQFTLGEFLPQSQAALPAGLAATLTTLGAWLKWRKPLRDGKLLPPPNQDCHYDI